MELHELAYKNMLIIKEIGVEKWLFEREEEYIKKTGGKENGRDH